MLVTFEMPQSRNVKNSLKKKKSLFVLKSFSPKEIREFEFKAPELGIFFCGDLSCFQHDRITIYIITAAVCACGCLCVCFDHPEFLELSYLKPSDITE